MRIVITVVLAVLFLVLFLPVLLILGLGALVSTAVRDRLDEWAG